MSLKLDELNAKVRACYLDSDYNCAETTLRVASEYFGLNLSNDALKVVGGFGGGMGRGDACGVLCSGIAVLSAVLIQDGGRAHSTKNFGGICGGWVNLFEKEFGASLCSALKPRYVKDENSDERCVELVTRGVKALIQYVESIK